MNGDRDDPSARGRRGNIINIPVSVECPLDSRILEITYDGREIMRPAVSKAEKLYRNASKIDFQEVDIETEPVDELVSVSHIGAKLKEKKTRERPSPATIVGGLESVRTKLSNAYTEISVLHDILRLSKERKYVQLQPTTNDNGGEIRPLEQKPYFSMQFKKSAVGNAAKILLGASQRLQSSMDIRSGSQKGENDYSLTLMKLRDHWRLKKSGVHVSGDLSYKTAGSALRNVGQFEIRKTDDDSEKAMDIIFAGDVAGESALQIDIDAPGFRQGPKNYEDNLRTIDPWPSSLLAIDNQWHRMLLAAQNSLFCREVITVLTAEATASQNNSLSSVAYSDEINYTSLNGHTVRAKLVQISEAESRKSRPAQGIPIRSDTTGTSLESRILEYSAAVMLLQRMRDMSNPDLPVPACGPLGLKNYRRKMSIQARDRRMWKHLTPTRSMTAELLDRVEALLLRKRCLNFVDEFSTPDLMILVHDTTALTSWKCANIKIALVTPGAETLHRTTCAFNFHQGALNFVTRDSVVPVHSVGSLDCQLLYMEVVRHHAAVAQHLLTKIHRFDILHYHTTFEYFKTSPDDITQSLHDAARYAVVFLARSFDEKWLVKVVCTLKYTYQLFVADNRLMRSAADGSLGKEYANPQPEFVQVDLSKVFGETKIRKLSMVLGYLLCLPESVTFLRHMQPNTSLITRDAGPTWKKWSAL